MCLTDKTKSNDKKTCENVFHENVFRNFLRFSYMEVRAF